MKWVRLKKYCELSGDTEYAVRHRRVRGIWLDGIHARLAPDKRLWVNLDEVNKWVEQGFQNPVDPSRSPTRKATIS